jgi:DGQHR domain-containing protein
MTRFLKATVVMGKVLGVNVYRGYADIADLAIISKPDIFDQKKNPTGTQRDLNQTHAKEAYEYVKSKDLAFWPEVFLCARDPNVLKFKPLRQDKNIGTLRININMAKNKNKITISRVDGNHRLHFTDGTHEGFPEIRKTVSFCLAYDLTMEQEIILFRDINNNQRRMNTSHLDNIESRLTPEVILKQQDPPLYIAKRLGEDTASPFYKMMYTGGKKPVDFSIPLRTLKTGINYMLSRRTKLTSIKDAEVQYKVIRNYFQSLKEWEPICWENPKDYLMLRGSGLWAICFIGAVVIDKALSEGNYQNADMFKILKSGKQWDWSNKGIFKGLGGRGGAEKISDDITSEFKISGKISLKDVVQKIRES